ncbi:hypothetical protein [Vibrio rumoiensis]|uniref:Uncharacterized protein n=1 Tax=Vibrio rumoiensis TaxID=76258 RepID=A0ABW7J2J1_9VIBR
MVKQKLNYKEQSENTNIFDLTNKATKNVTSKNETDLDESSGHEADEHQHEPSTSNSVGESGMSESESVTQTSNDQEHKIEADDESQQQTSDDATTSDEKTQPTKKELKAQAKQRKALEKENKKRQRQESAGEGVSSTKSFALAFTKLILSSSLTIGVCFIGYQYLEARNEKLRIEEMAEMNATIADLSTQNTDLSAAVQKYKEQINAMEMQNKQQNFQMTKSLDDLNIKLQEYVNSSTASLDMIKQIKMQVEEKGEHTEQEIESIKKQLTALEHESKVQGEQLLKQVRLTVNDIKPVATKPRPVPKKPSIQKVTSLDGLQLEAVIKFGSSNIAVFSNQGLGAVQRLEQERIGTFIIQKITDDAVTVKSIVDNETYIITVKG